MRLGWLLIALALVLYLVAHVDIFLTAQYAMTPVELALALGFAFGVMFGLILGLLVYVRSEQ